MENEANNENRKYDESRIYYVYKHVRLDNNTCFYIGKGKNGRKDDPNRNPTHDSICKEHGYKVVIFKDKLNEAEAFKLEEDLIRCYVLKMGYGILIKGYMNNNNNKFLTNMTWGGEGASGANKGRKHSEEHNKNISEARKGIQLSEETKQKLSEKLKGKNKGKYHSEETKRIIGEKMKGKNKGKHHSEEHNKKISESMKVKMAGENNPMAKKVICITTGKIFDIIKEAGNYYKCSNIVQCCKGRLKSAGKLSDGTKLQWKYLEDYNNEFKGILINPIIK